MVADAVVIATVAKVDADTTKVVAAVVATNDCKKQLGKDK